MFSSEYAFTSSSSQRPLWAWQKKPSLACNYCHFRGYPRTWRAWRLGRCDICLLFVERTTKTSLAKACWWMFWPSTSLFSASTAFTFWLIPAFVACRVLMTTIPELHSPNDSLSVATLVRLLSAVSSIKELCDLFSLNYFDMKYPET